MRENWISKEILKLKYRTKTSLNVLSAVHYSNTIRIWRSTDKHTILSWWSTPIFTICLLGVLITEGINVTSPVANLLPIRRVILGHIKKYSEFPTTEVSCRPTSTWLDHIVYSKRIKFAFGLSLKNMMGSVALPVRTRHHSTATSNDTSNVP